MTEYDPAGYLPPGLFDTTQIWDATGVKAKHCNNPVFPRWFPAFMYRGFGDPPFDAKAYPCAWQRNLPYNAWFPTSKWVSPATGTPKWEGGKPTGQKWGDPWGPYPYGNNFFCVLEESDGISEGSKSVPAGNWGNVYPKCFQAAGANAPFDRLYFEAVNDAQNVFRNGQLDDVTEINRADPYNRDPCGGRGSLAMLMPWALAVLAGVGTSIMLRYVVFDSVPPIALTSLSVGAAGFGWNFGQAIQAKPRDRDYYVGWASTFLATGAGVTGAVLAGYTLLDDWTAYEMPLILAGGAGGYFFLEPVIQPAISTGGGGLLGSTLGFLGTIVGGIEKFFCGISNWDIDGCSPEKNENARSWDRVLLAAAAADSLAKSHGLDDKEKEVAFQAMLVNAANVNAFENPTEKMETMMGFDVARSWTVGAAPPDSEDGKPTNSFANLGHVVQTELLPIEETQMQAWVQGLIRGQERNNKYMQTMFPKGEGALLQKCDQFSEIENVPQFARWMDLALQAAQKGQLAPTRIGVPIKLYNCQIVYTTFLQYANWETAMTYLRDFERDHNKGGLDYLNDCKESNAKLYYGLYAFASVKIEHDTTAGGAVIQIDDYVRAKIPPTVQTPEFYQLLLSSLGQWQFSSKIAGDADASEIWRKWARIADGGVLTACEIALTNIETGDTNWRALGAKAAQYPNNPMGCTELERGKFDAYRLFDRTTTCTNAVGFERLQFQNAPYGDKYKCGVGTAFSTATGFNCNADNQKQIDEWVAACSQ